MTSTNGFHQLGRASFSRMITDIALSSRQNFFNGCFQNIVGLLNNIDEFRVYLADGKLDFACLSETFLDDGVNDAVVAVDGFRLVRRDRSSGPKFRGGVAIYIRSCFQYRVIDLPGDLICQMSSDLEYILLEVMVGDVKCLICSI